MMMTMMKIMVHEKSIYVSSKEWGTFITIHSLPNLPNTCHTQLPFGIPANILRKRTKHLAPWVESHEWNSTTSQVTLSKFHQDPPKKQLSPWWLYSSKKHRWHWKKAISNHSCSDYLATYLSWKTCEITSRLEKKGSSWWIFNHSWLENNNFSLLSENWDHPPKRAKFSQAGKRLLRWVSSRNFIFLRWLEGNQQR